MMVNRLASSQVFGTLVKILFKSINKAFGLLRWKLSSSESEAYIHTPEGDLYRVGFRFGLSERAVIQIIILNNVANIRYGVEIAGPGIKPIPKLAEEITTPVTDKNVIKVANRMFKNIKQCLNMVMKEYFKT